MQIKGKLKVINEVNQVTDSFRKREFVITDDSTQYPQNIIVQLSQDKCTLIDGYSVGSEVTVSINLRGREWTSPTGEVRYFNTIEAWKIEGETQAPLNTPENVGGDSGDLPF